MGQRVDSTLDQVTVFPGWARVTRRAQVTVTGRAELHLAGLPLGLEDESLQVALDGPARAADLRVTLEVAARDEVTVDDREVQARAREAAAAAAVRDHLRSEVSGLGALTATSRGEREAPVPAWADALAARLSLLEARAARELEVRTELAAAERRVVEADRALAVARERRARASTEKREPGSVRKTVVITVEPEGDGGEVTVTLGYLVAGARWAPSYAVRLDGAGGLRFDVRASVVQATGEDWRGVRLEVSTAAPGRWLELPELPAQRIGRAQAAPGKPGWRPPPVGVDELFTDHDRGLPGRPAAPEAPRGQPPPPPQNVTASVQAMPLAAPMPMAAPMAPMPAMSAPAPVEPQAKRRLGAPAMKTMAVAQGEVAGASVERARRAAPGGGGGGGGATDDEPAQAELVVGAQLLVYARLRMAGPREARRGRLVPMSPAEAYDAPAAVAGELSRRPAPTLPALPPGLREVSRGVYDHSVAADGRVDVPADGSWHNLALGTRDGRVTLGHVVVPSVALEVFRQATFVNPLDAPLLAGPVDVYDRGELLTTTSLDTTAPGATLELGLGVDPAIKVARNARYHEEAAGMLRGSLKLLHEVHIDVDNRGPRAIALEVRERVPIPSADTEDVEVAVDRAVPPWEPWRPEPPPGQPPLRGGHRWRLDVAAGAKATLRVDYHVRISQKHELVGGNRREP